MKITDETSTLLRAYEQVQKLDLDKLFASGIDVALLSYTPERNDHMDRVTIPGEFFAPIKAAVAECLLKTIQRRQETVARELTQIEKITGRIS